MAQRTSSGRSPTVKKASSATNLVDDFSSLFGGNQLLKWTFIDNVINFAVREGSFSVLTFFVLAAAPLFGEFEEYEGETEERRRARLGRHQRTNDRVVCTCFDFLKWG